jgi:hypothetical protein
MVSHLFTAARVLVQFYQRALEINDLASANVLLAELEILKLAFKALGNRFAMGARHGGMLQAMLDRITVEFGGKVPLQTIEQAVPAVCSVPSFNLISFPLLIFSDVGMISDEMRRDG